MASPKVFLSVGRTSNSDQEDFVQAIERYLQMNGMTPQTVGRTYFSSKQPLVAVTELMQECVGTIILAYERMYLADAIEKRGSDQEKSWKDVTLPSVWNQIEATIAYTLGHPLLVIVGHGIKSEGLLERGYDWYVKWANISATIVSDSEFVGMFADWKKRTEAYWEERHAATAVSPRLPAASPTNRSQLSRLRQLLTTYFSENDLKLIAYDVGLDYADLPGDEFRLKAMQLVDEMNRRNRLHDLLTLSKQMRPEIEWDL